MMELGAIPVWSGWIVATALGIPAAIFYSRRLLRERRSERLQRDEGIREVMQMVRNSIAYAEQYGRCESSIARLSSDWFDARSWLKKGARNRLLRLWSLVTDFELWLRISNDLVAAAMCQAAYHEGTLSEFTSQMDNTGRGKFSDLLFIHLQYPVLSGQQITESWVRYNIPSLYDEMMKAGTEQDIEKVIKHVRRAAQNDCLQMMREKRQDFMQEAGQAIEYLASLTR